MRREASVVVKRPIEEVWAFLADLFHVPRYGVRALGLRQTSPGAIRVGSTIQARMMLLGLEWRIDAVITEWDPPHAMAFSARVWGTRSVNFRQTLEASADGTRVVRVVEVEPRPALKPLWSIYFPLFWRRQDAVAQKIKHLLEGRASGS